MADPIVRVDDLVVSFPSRTSKTPVEVISGAGLTVERGSCVVIIGPSGCGKSTILSCIAGLTPYTGGSITVDGDRVDGPDDHSSVVFQHASLLPWRTVLGNVEFGLESRRQIPKREIRPRALEAIEAVGLAGYEDHHPHQISGGMQQRVNLARAFAVRAPLTLMDEPFGALDALTKELMQDELIRLMSMVSSSTVFITHDIREAIYLGDKILVMSARPGTIIAEFDSPFGADRTRAMTEDRRFDELESSLRDLLGHTTEEVPA